VAAESVKDAEKSASEIMITHANDILLTENVGYVLAEPISDAGDLPKSWTTNCLPYTKYSSYTIPQELEDKTIEELL
jgi:hypothetical protein